MNGYRKSGDMRSLGEKRVFLCASRLKKLFKVSGISTRYVYTPFQGKISGLTITKPTPLEREVG